MPGEREDRPPPPCDMAAGAQCPRCFDLMSKPVGYERIEEPDRLMARDPPAQPRRETRSAAFLLLIPSPARPAFAGARPPFFGAIDRNIFFLPSRI